MAQANVLRDELGLHFYADCEDVDPQGGFTPGAFTCVASYRLFSESMEDEGLDICKKHDVFGNGY